MAPRKKKPIDISKAKASEIFFPDNEKEKDQVDDGEDGSATDDDPPENENEPPEDTSKKMDTSEIDTANLLGEPTAPPPKRAAAVEADAKLQKSPAKKPKIVKEEAAPTSDDAMIKAIYTKVANLERKVEQLLSISSRNTEHVVDLTRLEGKLDAAVATVAAVPIKSETSLVDPKAAVAFVESSLMSATVWPNFGGNEYWISKQRAALGPQGAAPDVTMVRFFFFMSEF